MHLQTSVFRSSESDRGRCACRKEWRERLAARIGVVKGEAGRFGGGEAARGDSIVGARSYPDGAEEDDGKPRRMVGL